MTDSERTKKSLARWHNRTGRLICMNGRREKDTDNPVAIKHFRHRPYGGMNESI